MKASPFSYRAGILLPISALPSRYGIGSLGREAYRFVDFLSQTGQSYWQVLPLNPTALGDSPYQSPSAMAGNPYFIDLDSLVRLGLLRKEEVEGARDERSRIDYGALFERRIPLLRIAYQRFVTTRSFKSFVNKNRHWLFSYALFMSLKEKNGFTPWTAWQGEERCFSRMAKREAELSSELSFWCFLQYCFSVQWEALHRYARERGIRIIGDMPIYVAHDSVEVYTERENFCLDAEGSPTLVAGCPPDAFSPKGQLWGNPIYRWDRMEENRFDFWLGRFARAFALYDVVRVDHFRGFAGYYAIPYGEDDATSGAWYAAPGEALFDTVREHFPKGKIIAEDLGNITEDVRALLNKTGFPGMKVLQFAFDKEDSEYLPRNFESDNYVVYTGTHDSPCTASWLRSLTQEQRTRLARECPHTKGQSRVFDLIELALSSPASLAIVPMQDYLSLTDEEGRMNTPSCAVGNWTYRLSPRYNTRALRDRIKALMEKTKRI